MRIDRTKLALASLLVVIIFLILAGFFWNFVRDTIAVPIYYLMWLGDLTLKSIPQGVFLGFLVVLLVLIGLNALLAVRLSGDVERAESRPEPSQARYHFWRYHCGQLKSSAYS